ncbi:MAG TPA: hypothetical protein DD738_01305 [Ruminiclostridium sp.]|nr:hypothetical protein [Ruminiclostridium sp.]
METILKLGFFSMANKVTDALGKSFPYILTGAVIAAIWIYFLFIVPKKSKRYESFSDYFHDVLNFRVMVTTGLAKILYIAFVIVLLVVGFVAMFAANFMVGLIGTIILQVLLRVTFELILVVFSIQENLLAIREQREFMEDEIQMSYDDEED